MRDVNRIFIHHSATTVDQTVNVEVLDQWHRARGFSGIGYHYVILRDGTVEKGRPELKVGAHVKNHNTGSLGICLVGGLNAQKKAENNFTDSQFNALRKLLKSLIDKYGEVEVLGHKEVAQTECPPFDVQAWLADNLAKTDAPSVKMSVEITPQIETQLKGIENDLANIRTLWSSTWSSSLQIELGGLEDCTKNLRSLLKTD